MQVTEHQDPQTVVALLDPWIAKMVTRYAQGEIYQDVCQEARIAVFKAFGTYRPDLGVPFDYYVKKRAEWAARTTIGTGRWTGHEAPEHQDGAVKYVKKQSHREKVIAYRRAHPEVSQATIAKDLRISVSTVNFHLQRAAEAERTEITECFIVDDDKNFFDIRDEFSVEDLVLSNTFVARIIQVIQEMPYEAQVVTLGRINGESWPTIAQELGKSTTVARYTWKKIRDDLIELVA